jgi:hypothetical protein
LGSELAEQFHGQQQLLTIAHFDGGTAGQGDAQR